MDDVLYLYCGIVAAAIGIVNSAALNVEVGLVYLRNVEGRGTGGDNRFTTLDDIIAVPVG